MVRRAAKEAGNVHRGENRVLGKGFGGRTARCGWGKRLKGSKGEDVEFYRTCRKHSESGKTYPH